MVLQKGKTILFGYQPSVKPELGGNVRTRDDHRKAKYGFVWIALESFPSSKRMLGKVPGKRSGERVLFRLKENSG